MSVKEEAVAIATLELNSDDLKDIKSGQIATSQSVLMAPGTYPRSWTIK